MLRIRESAQKDPCGAADPCHKPPACASAGGGWLALKNDQNECPNRHDGLHWPGCGPIWFPIPPQSAAGRGPLYHCMGLFSRFLSRETPWRHARTSKLPSPRSSVYCSCGRSPVPQVHDDG